MTSTPNNPSQPAPPRSDRVVVCPYDPLWPAAFLRIYQTLAPALSGLVEAIEHVGSTSVPGLAAKPIIDIDVVIQTPSDFEPVSKALETLGYQHRGDLGVPGREAFSYTGKPDLMAHHLYVCPRDSNELTRHLAFRDYLRANPVAREQYAVVKQAAAQHHPHDIAAYIDEKSDFIQSVLERLGLLAGTIQGRLPGLLGNRYGLTLQSFEPVTGGTAASDFHIIAEEGHYFLKCYDKSRDSTPLFARDIPVYVPLLLWLNQVPGLSGFLPQPIPTCTGKPFCEDNLALYLLYAYLHGTTLGKATPSRIQVESLAHIIATLHRLDVNTLPDLPIRRENFELPFLAELTSIAQGAAPFDLPADVHVLMQAYAELITVSLRKAEALQHQLRADPLPLVLCHTDLHGWNMMDCDGRFIVLDWEGLRLSPAEADLVFMVEPPYHPDFMPPYQQARPGFALDDRALRFFRIRRQLEDVWLFLRELSLDTLAPDHREQVFAWFHSGLETLGKERLFLG